MTQRRFYVPANQISGGTAVLSRDQAHRIRHVLRLVGGDEVELFDGTGSVYCGRVDPAGRTVRVIDLKPAASEAPSHPRLVLAPAVIKPARFEWMLEKTTELGVDEFIPLMTRFSEFQTKGPGLQTKIDRWLRIVRQACEQCGRTLVPPIRQPIAFGDFLALNLSEYTRLLCYEKSGSRSSRQSFSGPVVLCIGPEGGWDACEIVAALRSGFKLASLGVSVLRAETAAVAAVSLIRISDAGLRIQD